ncbi:MAG: hypothetical protein ABMA13_20615 [Chthoniobacteraceae bacterium]
MASFVITLARETGWSEDFILNVLPMSRALQYRHCILRAAGYWTVPPSGAPDEQMTRLRAARLPVSQSLSLPVIPPPPIVEAWAARLKRIASR